MNNLIMNNQLINQSANKRNYVLRTIFLTVIGLALAIFTTQIKAETVSTLVRMSDQGAISFGRVTVFDAHTGRQVANGETTRQFYGNGSPDNGKAGFNFSGPAFQRFVVVVRTYRGFIGVARGNAGELINVDGSPLATLDLVNADENGNATLIYKSGPNRTPVKNAVVTIVEWSTFGNARRGKTNAQGEYLFNAPNDLSSLDFLAVEWKGDEGTVHLTGILTGDHTSPGDDGSGV